MDERTKHLYLAVAKYARIRALETVIEQGDKKYIKQKERFEKALQDDMERYGFGLDEVIGLYVEKLKPFE